MGENLLSLDLPCDMHVFILALCRASREDMVHRGGIQNILPVLASLPLHGVAQLDTMLVEQ